MISLDARPKPAYMHGAVKEATHERLVEALNRLHEAVPISLEHRRLLREAGSEFVYARAIPQGDDRPDVWLVLLRFGAVLEGRFGFTREVPVLYSPFSDLQIRTTDRIEAHLRGLPPERRSVSSSEIFVYAPDRRLETKLDSWSAPSRVLIPLPSPERLHSRDASPLNDFINLLAKRLASRDLYSSKGYVTGDQFFGRMEELQGLRDAVRRREVTGVFGLRKTGKTSLLHELIRSTDLTYDDDDRKLLFVYQDLEHLPSLDYDPVPDLLLDLAEQLRRKLASEDLRTREVADLTEGVSPSQFRRALDKLLERIEGEATIVLILDEIEYLCPPNPGPDTSSESFQRVRQLFGGLRKLTQERDNFVFIIAGLASAAIERPELYGAPNPLFSYAEPLYLSPLDAAESEELLNSVGRKVSMHWTDSAIDAALELSSGHALLLREIGSCVLAEQKHGRSNIVQLKAGHVARVADEWRQRVVIHLSEVLPHLRRYYPDDAELAVMLIEDESQFLEYGASFPESIYRLQRLGIIYRLSSGRYSPAPLLSFSYGFQQRIAARGKKEVPVTFSLTSEQLALMDESEELEFKESVRSHDPAVPDEVIVDEVLRAILGFMNQQGGTLLVGVRDDGTVLGIGADTKLMSSYDKLELFVTRRINEKIGDVGVDLISIRAEYLEGVQVMRFDVCRSPKPVFPKKPVKGKSGLWVRNNASTQQLQDAEAVDFIARNWV